MKLESLNNSKYSLTPEKMGQLVGGQVTCVTTGAGVASTGNNRQYSADTRTSYTGEDMKPGPNNSYISAEVRYYRGDQDVCNAANACDCINR